MNPIEEAFVKAFIAPDRKDRWLQFLPSEKNRTKILARLPHTFYEDCDPRFVYDKRNLPPKIAAQVEAALTEWRTANPAQMCHIIACSSEQDGTMMRFADTARELPQGFGAIAIVIPDRLAYYYAENYLNKEPHYVLFRP